VKRLAILGASGHGKVVADAALAAGWQEVTFFDDAWPDVGSVGQWAVAGTMSHLVACASRYDGVVVAIGDNATRVTRHRQLVSSGATPAAIVHPAATVSRFAELGPGSVVIAGAVLNAYAKVGAACIVNTSASIDHDCELADGVHVSPGAHLGGGVRVGESTWIGIGAAVRHGVSIGSGVIVGAGAVVVEDVISGVTVVGVPAKPVVSLHT
jgi:sugar O-acyltransferase (sialic acid O-acetyltransferase NeuD family)